MSWCKRLLAICEMHKNAEYAVSVAFHSPALSSSISELEHQLAVFLPDSLRSLLAETNGVTETMEVQGELKSIGWIVFALDEIRRTNESHRTTLNEAWPDIRFEDFLFFSSPGVDGLLYAFVVDGTHCRDDDIVIWYPLDNLIKNIASSLEEFLSLRIRGKAF